jgi:hypothetical protein
VARNGCQEGAISEGSLYTSATFRLRHAYLKLENDVVNVLLGRTPQLRLPKSLKTDAVDIDLTVGAMRPPQRDSTAD